VNTKIRKQLARRKRKLLTANLGVRRRLAVAEDSPLEHENWIAREDTVCPLRRVGSPLSVDQNHRAGMYQQHCDSFFNDSVIGASVVGASPRNFQASVECSKVLSSVMLSHPVKRKTALPGRNRPRIAGSRVRQRRFFGSSRSVRFRSFLYALVGRLGRIDPNRLGYFPRTVGSYLRVAFYRFAL